MRGTKQTTIIPIVFFLCYSFMLQSCNVYTGAGGYGGSSTRTNPQYIVQEKITEQGVAVSLPSTQIVIGNEDDVTNDLGIGNAKEVYLNYFKMQFPKAITRGSKFENVIFYNSKYGVEMDKSFALRTHVMGTNSYMKIHEPIKGTHISTGDTSVRYILFIEGFKISRDNFTLTTPNSSVPGSPDSKNVVTSAVLNHKLVYALWDTEKEMTVSFGKVDEEVNVGLKMAKEDWATILENIVKDIVKGTQFEK